MQLPVLLDDMICHIGGDEEDGVAAAHRLLLQPINKCAYKTAHAWGVQVLDAHQSDCDLAVVGSNISNVMLTCTGGCCNASLQWYMPPRCHASCGNNQAYG